MSIRAIFDQQASPDAAARLCEAHSLDSAVLVTSDPQGLYAIRAPAVKAVILKRALPDGIADFFNALGDRSRALVTAGLSLDSSVCLKRRIAENGISLPPVLADDMTKNGRLFPRLFNWYSKMTMLGEEGIRGPKSDSRVPHIDTSPTLHTAYAGQGLEIFLGDMTPEQYAAVRREKDACRDLPSEILQPGEIVVFKGNDAPHKEGAMPGLLHRTPRAQGPRVALAIYGSG